MPLKLTALVTDDHKIFRVGMVSTLKSLESVNNILEAENGMKALEIVRRYEVDIVFMDIRMPVMDGIRATEIIKKEKPDIKIIAVSMFDDLSYVTEMIANGASAYLLKNTDADEIEEAIETVMRGEHYFSRDLSGGMLASLLVKSNLPQLDDGTYELSEREEQILPLICEGFLTKEIASTLNLSFRTIDGHRARMLEKTKCKNTPELVAYAIKHGYWKQK